MYTEWLGSEHEGVTPRLHVNYVPQTATPYNVTLLEKHPYAAQIFLPLMAERYMIVVTPSLPDGSPDLSGAKALIAPGNLGVVYKANTWHAGATAIDGKAHFAVHMWRNDKDDDEFLTLSEPITISL